jgi:hypothetical protein
MSVPYYANAPMPNTNARQVAQVIRMPSTALLTIDSEDRYKDYAEARTKQTSPYNFTISKSESLMNGFMTRIGISEVVFPWTVPNINLKTQDIFVSSINGAGDPSDAIITLPAGFYTPSQIATSLSSLISAYLVLQGDAPASFVCAYGLGDLPQFSFTYTGTGVLILEPMVPNSQNYPYGPGAKQLYDILGLGGFGGTGTSITATPVIGQSTLCQAIRYVDIVCNQLTNSQAQKDQTSQTVVRDMLCRVYIAGSPTTQSTVLPSSVGFVPTGCAPTVIYRNFTMPKQIQWIPNQNIPGFLQFQVYDDAGDLLEESIPVVVNAGPTGFNGYGFTDWSMTMLVSEV